MRLIALMTEQEVRTCKNCGKKIAKGEWHYMNPDSYAPPPNWSYDYYCENCRKDNK